MIFYYLIDKIRENSPIAMDSYKEAHEHFVANNTGTRIGDLIVCLAHIPVFVFWLKEVQGRASPSIVRDCIFLSIPVLLVVTVLVEYHYFTVCILYISSILWYIWKKTASKNVPHTELNDTKTTPDNLHKKTSYLTLFKGKIFL